MLTKTKKGMKDRTPRNSKIQDNTFMGITEKKIQEKFFDKIQKYFEGGVGC